MEWVVTVKRCVIHTHTQCAHSGLRGVRKERRAGSKVSQVEVQRARQRCWLCTHLRTHESQQPQPGNAFAKKLLLLLILLQLQLHRAVPDALTTAGDTFLCGCQKYHFIATKMTTLSRLTRCPPIPHHSLRLSHSNLPLD